MRRKSPCRAYMKRWSSQGSGTFTPMRMFSYLPCHIYLVKMFMRCTWPHVDGCSFMGHTLFYARHHRVTQLSTHQRVTQYACCINAAGILHNSLSIKTLGITKYQQTSVQTKDTVTIIDDLFSVSYENHRMAWKTRCQAFHQQSFSFRIEG